MASATDNVVFLEESNYGGWYIYRVMVDYRKYDEFASKKSLTWAQQSDVAAGYREALDGYSSPSVVSP